MPQTMLKTCYFLTSILKDLTCNVLTLHDLVLFLIQNIKLDFLFYFSIIFKLFIALFFLTLGFLF